MRRWPVPAHARAPALSLALLLACGACLAAPPHAVLRVEGRDWRLDLDDGGTSVVVTDGVVSRTLESASLDGRRRGRVVSVATAPARRSFLVAIDTLPELWEVSVDPKAEPIFDGLVHDWRMSESLPRPGFLHPRRTPLPRAMSTLAPQAVGPWLLAQAGDSTGVCSVLAWIHLDARTVVQTLRLRGTIEWSPDVVDVPARDAIDVRVLPPAGAATQRRRIVVPVARDGRAASPVDECSPEAARSGAPAPDATQPTR
jgi:hypothetical protein